MNAGIVSTAPSPDLRSLVQEVIREVVGEMRGTPTRPTAHPDGTDPTPAAAATFAKQIGVTPTGPLDGAGRQRTETVRISNESDLRSFVFTLLGLFENPKIRADLRAGRLKFALTGSAAAHPTAEEVHRVDRGAVTERQIAAIAEAGGRLVLGPAAVLTPLAREKARTLGVPFEKERR